MFLSIIVAMDNKRLIGRENELPWRLSADLRYFKKNTLGKAIIMGRKTYESIGKPLVDRRNIVISANVNFTAAGCEVVHSIAAALKLVENESEAMIIGGAYIYQQLLSKAQRLYITQIQSEFVGDAYFPDFDIDNYVEISREKHTPDDSNNYAYDFVVLDKK